MGLRSWQQLPFTSFVIVLWDRSVLPYRVVLKWRVPLADLMYLASSDLELPPNTLLFHMADGIYVPKETRLALEERAVIVRDESAREPPPPLPAAAAASVTPSLSRQSLLELIHRKQDCDRLREQLVSLDRTVTGRLQDQEQLLELQRRIAENQETVSRLRDLSARKRELLERDRDALSTRRAALLPEARAIKDAQISLCASVAKMEQQREQLVVQHQRLQEASFFIRAHASRLITQLRTVYRVEQRSEDGSFTINGIVLPNSVFTNCDEETVAAGLGHVCHVLHLLSRYLGVPLRYPMKPMQTRSTIEDPISNVGKYPLYSKNQDPTQFEYAVFLLNKNLEQLIHSEGLEIDSLRPTLPNLKLLLDSFHSELDEHPSLSASPSVSS